MLLIPFPSGHNGVKPPIEEEIIWAQMSFIKLRATQQAMRLDWDRCAPRSCPLLSSLEFEVTLRCWFFFKHKKWIVLWHVDMKPNARFEHLWLVLMVFLFQPYMFGKITMFRFVWRYTGSGWVRICRYQKVRPYQGFSPKSRVSVKQTPKSAWRQSRLHTTLISWLRNCQEIHWERARKT